jgi:hypothetical protein
VTAAAAAGVWCIAEAIWLWLAGMHTRTKLQQPEDESQLLVVQLVFRKPYTSAAKAQRYNATWRVLLCMCLLCPVGG